MLNNKRIVDYHATTSLRATSDEVPWCASFVNWCLKKATIAGTNSARARSFLTWGVAVSLEEAQRGDIVVLSRGVNVQFGHVGFFVGRTAEFGRSQSVLILGGNQSDKVSISPYPLHRILSIRRAIIPSPPPQPSTFRTPSVFNGLALRQPSSAKSNGLRQPHRRRIGQRLRARSWR
jgi:uncharacterized protein (TIGR02594 family)